jgi:anti-anti-sigma factor
MEISVRELERVDVIAVKGLITSDEAPLFERTINDLFKRRHHRIVLDLGEVELMSSAGLRILTLSLQETRKHGGNLILANVSPRVFKSIELVGLSNLIPISDDVVGAVGQF